MSMQNLKSAETDETTRDDALAISDTMTRRRIMIGRRVIGRMAIAKLSPELELSHLDVLDVVHRTEGDATVGSIAEGMRLDPSRGSRLVSDMVGRGLLRRDVSQEDGRRSVIAVTPLGLDVLDDVRSAKIAIIRDVVSDWPDEDIAAFAQLFDRFIGRFETRLSPDARL